MNSTSEESDQTSAACRAMASAKPLPKPGTYLSSTVAVLPTEVPVAIDEYVSHLLETMLLHADSRRPDPTLASDQVSAGVADYILTLHSISPIRCGCSARCSCCLTRNRLRRAPMATTVGCASTLTAHCEAAVAAFKQQSSASTREECCPGMWCTTFGQAAVCAAANILLRRGTLRALATLAAPKLLRGVSAPDALSEDSHVDTHFKFGVLQLLGKIVHATLTNTACAPPMLEAQLMEGEPLLDACVKGAAGHAGRLPAVWLTESAYLTMEVAQCSHTCLCANADVAKLFLEAMVAHSSDTVCDTRFPEYSLSSCAAITPLSCCCVLLHGHVTSSLDLCQVAY